MSRFFKSRHRGLLFRTYLFLVAGLLLTAVVLDMGFDYLQSGTMPEEDQWLATSFDLIERELSVVPTAERATAVERLSRDIKLGIQLLERSEIVGNVQTRDPATSLVDADGNTFYLRDTASLNGLIRLGPVAPQEERLLLRLLPPLFYLSIFVIVGFWLRPLLRDLDLITGAAQRFASDYREPLSTASETSQLSGLARHLDDMSSRISGLIRSQKELIAALSHEMRTPLARIRFALAVIDNDERHEIKTQIGALNKDVQEIDELIATMLNYARLDHPELRMTWQNTPIAAWIEQTIDKCRQAHRNITVYDIHAPKAAWMDPRLMGLALSNLLVNACHYANEEICCTMQRANGQYRIDVEDDGKGIPESEQETIFKAFSRIDDSRSRETGGFGLGLAIVARIAALHGGTVKAGTSASLGGAMFTLCWPANQPADVMSPGDSAT